LNHVSVFLNCEQCFTSQQFISQQEADASDSARTGELAYSYVQHAPFHSQRGITGLVSFRHAQDGRDGRVEQAKCGRWLAHSPIDSPSIRAMGLTRSTVALPNPARRPLFILVQAFKAARGSDAGYVDAGQEKGDLVF
jgi:hypothetical protein